MAVRHFRDVIVALADPEALFVFGVIVAATSSLRREGSGRSRPGTWYVTPFGVMRQTALPREAIEAAAERLKRAGVLEVQVDEERGYESWRVDGAALAAAAGDDICNSYLPFSLESAATIADDAVAHLTPVAGVGRS